jgi:hypothetical protein
MKVTMFVDSLPWVDPELTMTTKEAAGEGPEKERAGREAEDGEKVGPC